MALVSCKNCSKEFKVVPARLPTAKYCSYRCKADWRVANRMLHGENNPNYRGGYFKPCGHCGEQFWVIPATQKKKFCSKPCADKSGFRYTGKDHPNYREEARRKNRGGSHHKWVNAVLSRDKATCQKCGAQGIELHAHHIKSFKDHPELRFDLDNGMTLCFRCHWLEHTASNENSVNSVDTRPSNVEGNTEPSSQRKLLEGVTTRGRASRRIVTECDWCKAVISKSFSDAKGKKHLFCSYSCSAHWKVKFLGTPRQREQAVISSKSAGRESEDIV